jgi:hypothetical protein
MADTAAPIGGRASPTVTTAKGARHEDRAVGGHGGAKAKAEKGMKFLNFGLLGLVLLGWLAWLIMLAGAPRSTCSCTCSHGCRVRAVLPRPAWLGYVAPRHARSRAFAPRRKDCRLPGVMRCTACVRSHRPQPEIARHDCAQRQEYALGRAARLARLTIAQRWLQASPR